MSNCFQQQLIKQLTQTFTSELSQEELYNCLKHIKILKPLMERKFWQSQDVTAGIFIILKGKVKLLDSQDKFLTTLGVGESFGELTLFCRENFQPYAAQAEANLLLCFVPYRFLFPIINQSPKICRHLHYKAIVCDSLGVPQDIPTTSNSVL